MIFSLMKQKKNTETFEIIVLKSRDKFSSNTRLELEEEKEFLGVYSLKESNLVFNKSKNNEKFPFYTQGYWGDAQIFNIFHMN